MLAPTFERQILMIKSIQACAAHLAEELSKCPGDVDSQQNQIDKKTNQTLCRPMVTIRNR